MAKLGRRRTSKLMVAFALAGIAALTACNNAQTPAAVEIATPQPTATPEPTATTQPTATPTPEPPTAVPPTPRPTVAPPPTTAAANVNFLPVSPGIGPFNYPDSGLDQIRNDREAEALWAVIELNNAVARMIATGSTEDLPAWERVKQRGLVAPEYAENVEAIADPNRIARMTEESAIVELVATRDDALVLTVCLQVAFEVSDSSGAVVEVGKNTTTRAYTFTPDGTKFQLTGLLREPVSGEELVPCAL